MITLTQQDLAQIETILLETPYRYSQPILAILTKAVQAQGQPQATETPVEG